MRMADRARDITSGWNLRRAARSRLGHDQGGKCQFRAEQQRRYVVRISNLVEGSICSGKLIASPRAYVTLDLIPLNKEQSRSLRAQTDPADLYP